MAQDTTTPLHFSLVEESSGITGIGGLTPGLPSQEPQISGTRVTVLDYDPDSRVLEVMDSGRVQSKLVVPKDVPLRLCHQAGPYGIRSAGEEPSW